MEQVTANVLSEVNKELEGSGTELSRKFLSKFSRDYVMDVCWASVNRGGCAKVLELIAGSKSTIRLPIDMGSLSYGRDLGCEWTYVIDLDNGVLEVFEGHEDKKCAYSTRFHDLLVEEGYEDSQPVPCFATGFPLAEMPAIEEEFINEVVGAIGSASLGIAH